MWMGQWLPSSAGRTSNWKELKTIELPCGASWHLWMLQIFEVLSFSVSPTTASRAM